MKQYFSFFRIRFTSGLQYRVAAWSGACTQLFWGLMEVLMFRAFYLYAPDKLPMDIQALSNYVWIQQATLSLWNVMSWEYELFQSVQTGTVAYELIRPSNLYAMWSARSFGNQLSRAALRFAPVVLAGSLLPAPYGLRLTIPVSAIGIFAISLFFTLWLCVAIKMLCYAATFFVTDYRGITTFLVALTEGLSGDLLPLPFFPTALRRIAEYSPFGSLQNVPLRIFGGDIAGAACISAVGLQLFWCLSITGLGCCLMHRGLRKAVIAGG